VVELAPLGGLLLLLGFLVGLEARDVLASLIDPPTTPAELLGRGENSPALFDFDDIARDWFPERKAS
jgi:hypothetical protein